MSHHPARGVVGGLALTLALTGCGLPSSNDATEIDDQDVPFGLMAPSDQATPQGDTTSTPSQPDVPSVVWVIDASRLVAQRESTAPGGSTEEQLTRVLDLLDDGPDQRGDGTLGTALAPDATLELDELTGDDAVIEFDPGTPGTDAALLPLSIGQIVLSAVSVAGVSRVELRVDGEPMEVPLPGGALTSRPLVEADYRELLQE